MNILKTFITLLIIAVTCNTTYAQEWYKVKSKEGKFKALIPCDVEITEEQKEGYKNVYYQCVIDGTVFQVSATIHEGDDVAKNDPIEMADVSVEAIREAMNGELIKNQPYTIGKHVGKSAYFIIPDKNMTVNYHVILIKNIQYQILIINTNVDKPQEEKRIKFQENFKPKK